MPIVQRVALVAFSLLLLLPGTSASLFDRDEGWYAQVLREMAQRGDYIVPTYLGQPWLLKPPLLYWLAAPLARLFRGEEWALRLVSVLAMTVAVQLLWSIAAKLYDRRVAWFASLAFLTAGLPAVVGRLFITDAVLLACLLGASLAFLDLRRSGFADRRAVAFWACVGLAVLAKGPAVAVYILGLFGAHVLTKRAESRIELRTSAETPPTPCTPLLYHPRFWAWAPVGMLPAIAWFTAAAVRAGDALWAGYFSHELASRFTAPVHGHVGPPGYYLVTSFAGWLPWSLLLPGAVFEAWRARRAEPNTRFAFWWLVLPWAALELVPGKLPHYVLPCYAPLALLLGRAWVHALEKPLDWGQRLGLQIWAALPALLGVVAICAALAFVGDGRVRFATALTAGVLIIGFAAALIVLIVRDAAEAVRCRRAFGVAVGSMATFYVMVGAVLLPTLEPHRLSRTVAEVANRQSEPGSSALLACGYDEPTLFYYLRNSAAVVSPDELPARLQEEVRDRQPAVLILSAANYGRLPADLTERFRFQRIRGVNYSKGAAVEVLVGRLDARADR
jgi:4-amino-4-deoxy-L-arabinose transferase-like glycosyltransferase